MPDLGFEALTRPKSIVRALTQGSEFANPRAANDFPADELPASAATA